MSSRTIFIRAIAIKALFLLLLDFNIANAAEPVAAQVDQYVASQMQRLRIPGMAVAVVKDGHIALVRSYGTASVEFGVPVSDDTVFAINSVTKAFTGVAAMREVQLGRLDLAAPVERYLNDLPPSWHGVTIRQLLSHTSGLPDVLRAPTVETDEAAAWDWLRTQAPLFAPGTRFHYCQTNYMLVQRIINQLEGRAQDAPLAEEQVRVAGMTSTAYGDAYSVIPRKAPTYRWQWTGPKVHGYPAPTAASSMPGSANQTLTAVSERFLPFRRAASGMNSSAIDMARWLLALQQNKLLNDTTLNTMWTPVAFNNGHVGQWGMGWQILQRGSHRAVGMTGGGRAAFYLYPEDKVGIVILTNLTGSYPEDMIDKLAALYIPDLPLSGVPGLRVALEARGYDQANQAATDIEHRYPDQPWQEDELNDWGYRLLAAGRPADALAVLKLTAERFPASYNAQDSLGEALAVNGQREAAKRAYQRVLELHPGDANALKQLESL
ncbi:serine hydrolase [Duganella sp. FT80W]|uniref:Serine hydrolase n=1 Tax=Duganella guangzhouensis TaxID=2666084 RepID=A0A6I2L272_9BURK|nr:serine hydrolase [Duganella guangzhouensis]MRW92013.1 serine hydrolase [Duganella guangzhouensis]